MKLKFAICSLLFFAGSFSYGQSIWTNPVTGSQPSLSIPYLTGQTFDPNISVSGIVPGSALLQRPGTDRYNFSNWTGGIGPNSYFEFKLTPVPGYKIDFLDFDYSAQASATGPTTFDLRSSLNAYATTIAFLPAAGGSVSLTALPFQNIGAAGITFRLYAYNASAATGTFSINDFTFNGSVNATCASVPLTSVLPTNGPVGTEVTITAAAGLTGATATIGGITAPIVTTTATQLVVTVPAGAASGNLVVKNSALCASAAVPFTVIKENKAGCAGSTTPTELFISEVADSNAGNLSYVEIFNGTGSSKILSGYSIKVANNGGAYSYTLTLSNVSLASGSIYVVAFGNDGFCSTLGGDGSYADQSAGNNGGVNFGPNKDDHYGLFKGAVLIDSWGTFGSGNWAPGFVSTEGATFRRKNNVTPLPNPTYSNSDWNIIDFAGTGSANCGNNDYSDIGTFVTFKTPPNLVSSPTATVSCTTTSITLSASGTEGVVDAIPIAYQWYYLAPATNVWTAVPNNAIYSGAASANLTISPITTLNNYQYYCQIRENTATCYTATNAVIIKDNYSTTWDGSMWLNGLPSPTKRAVIAGNYDTTTNGSFECCSLTVNAGFTLNITAMNYVSIQNNLTVSATGTLTVQDDGSLIQVNNTGVNTGVIASKRDVTLKKYDYVYWSSPVAGTAVTAVSPGTLASYIYKWLPTQAGSYGIWTNANETMVAGKGYIVRGPSAFPNTPQLFSTTFSGVPNNGIINKGIERGSYTAGNYNNANGVVVTNKDDNWNLVGNPYPSSINAISFLAANGNIEGAVRLWTHGAYPSAAVIDPFYGNYLYNYNSSDYVVYNSSGTSTGPATFNGNIASGQGFFICMNDGPADNTQSVVFNNSMRNKTYSNEDFFRNGNQLQPQTQHNDGVVNRSRIWLDLINNDGAVNRILLAYADGATMDKDRMFDAFGRIDNNQNFYSLIGSEPMTIQGRPLPFDANDIVSLGMKLVADSSYKIAISATDGLFANNNSDIFLEDKLLGIVHDLKQAPYNFSAQTGTFDNRFSIKYTNTTLGSNSFSGIENNIAIATDNNQLAIRSSETPISEVVVFDLLGRELYSKRNLSGNEVKIETAFLSHRTLIVKVVLENGATVSKKVIL